MQGYIKVTSTYERGREETLYINIQTIGHVYRVKEKQFVPEEKEVFYTVIGTTCHNNGGFHVKEPVDYVLRLIEEASWNSITQ